MLAAVVLAVGFSTGRLDWAAAAALGVAASAWRHFVPVVYELGTLGVTMQTLSRHRRIAWRAIDHYDLRSTGVFLSPHPERGPLDAFSGMYLPWGSYKDEVLANVEFYLASRRG